MSETQTYRLEVEMKRGSVFALLAALLVIAGCAGAPNKAQGTFTLGAIAGVAGCGVGVLVGLGCLPVAAVAGAGGAAVGLAVDAGVQAHNDSVANEALARAIANGNPGISAAHAEGLARYNEEVQADLQERAYLRGRRGEPCC
jgi:hypothetical protein